MARELDQQPDLPDQDAAEEIDALLTGSGWQRTELRGAWCVREGTHDSARYYTGGGSGWPFLVDSEVADWTLDDAILLRDRVLAAAEQIGAKVSPVIQWRHVAVIVTEWTTE